MVNFIIGGILTFGLLLAILAIRYAITQKDHLTQTQLTKKLRDIADRGMTQVTTAVHAMDIVSNCPVRTKITRIDENLYVVREVKS